MCFGGGGGGGRDTDAAMDPKGATDYGKKSAGEKLRADLAFGLGLSKDRPYGYDLRTERAQKRAEAERERERQTRGDSDNRSSSSSSSSSSAAARSRISSPGEAPMPPGAPGTGPAGAAEQAVEEGAKTRKGRASTIATSPEGLMSEAKTRQRRSLMGGLIR